MMEWLDQLLDSWNNFHYFPFLSLSLSLFALSLLSPSSLVLSKSPEFR